MYMYCSRRLASGKLYLRPRACVANCRERFQYGTEPLRDGLREAVVSVLFQSMHLLDPLQEQVV